MNIHQTKVAAGRKGGLSRSPAKIEATRLNAAHARDVRRIKRLHQLCPGPVADGVDSVTMAPVVDKRGEP